MKILLISSAVNEGAGAVPNDLAAAFERGGDECRILTGWPPGKSKRVETLYGHDPAHPVDRLFRFFKFLAGGRARKPEMVHKYQFRGQYDTITFASTNRFLNVKGFIPECIIVLFNVNLVSCKNLHEIATIAGIPILVMPMDMKEFTGGCHYSWDCKGYTKGCFNCPAVVTSSLKRYASENLAERKRYLKSPLFQFIAASSQLHRQMAESSLLHGAEIPKILLGMPTDTFCPRDRMAARAALGLPQEPTIIFLGAMSVAEERKGFSYLLEALELIDHSLRDTVHIVAIGMAVEAVEKIEGYGKTFLGRVAYEAMPCLYQAADMFVCPSIEDSGPSMINQSILCGTPVVCFEMGVAADLVHTGITGYRARLRDANDLAQGIQSLLKLSKGEKEKMSEQCRELGLQKCDIDNLAHKLRELSAAKSVAKFN